MESAAEPLRGSDLASTMLARITATTSHADALKELRTAFPESPLAVRVAALELLRRRGAGETPHIPR
jgi:hypothetical protein